MRALPQVCLPSAAHIRYVSKLTHHHQCSIKYHLLHPEYILTRMRQLGSKFNLSIVLCLVDVEGSTQPLEVGPGSLHILALSFF